MAKISALELVGAADGTEVVPVVKGGRAKRMALSALALAMTPFLAAYYKGDKGDPGSPAGAPIGLFADIPTLPIPVGVQRFATTGRTLKGIGCGTYVEVSAPAVEGPAADGSTTGRVLAQATAWRVKSADGRWWELLPDPYVTFDQLGTVGRPGFAGNDVQGWKDISAYLAEKNGAALKGRRTTYAVGEQTRRPGSLVWAYEPSPVLKGEGLSGPVHIDFMGATLRCIDGLRYGAFKADGTPAPFTPSVYPNGQFRSTPYSGMIEFSGCSGPIVIEAGDLDGNQAGLYLGGGYGDTGYQIPAIGLNFGGNSGGVIWRNMRSFDHGQDGAQLATTTPNLASPFRRILIENCEFDRNGRQAMSIIGGRGGIVRNCRFTRSGMGRVYSAPGAGLDIEAEANNLNRDWLFELCEFRGNMGVACVAASGDSADITFSRCLFVGGNNWALWPRKPGMKFRDCRIVGSMVAPYADGGIRPDGSVIEPGVASNKSTEFHSCEFTNDPAYSATASDLFLINAGAYDTAALYSYCEFRAVGDRVTIVTGRSTRFHSCRFTQERAADMSIAGVFTGDNVLDIPAPAYIDEVSRINDRLYLRGVRQQVTA